MAFEPVNFAILKQPLNWIIVILMLLIAAFALHYLKMYLVTQHNNTSEQA